MKPGDAFILDGETWLVTAVKTSTHTGASFHASFHVMHPDGHQIEVPLNDTPRFLALGRLYHVMTTEQTMNVVNDDPRDPWRSFKVPKYR